MTSCRGQRLWRKKKIRKIFFVSQRFVETNIVLAWRPRLFIFLASFNNLVSAAETRIGINGGDDFVSSLMTVLRRLQAPVCVDPTICPTTTSTGWPFPTKREKG